jgi:hypothetical protein
MLIASEVELIPWFRQKVPRVSCVYETKAQVKERILRTLWSYILYLIISASVTARFSIFVRVCRSHGRHLPRHLNVEQVHNGHHQARDGSVVS